MGVVTSGYLYDIHSVLCYIVIRKNNVALSVLHYSMRKLYKAIC